jgi:hypothetical protein
MKLSVVLALAVTAPLLAACSSNDNNGGPGNLPDAAQDVTADHNTVDAKTGDVTTDAPTDAAHDGATDAGDAAADAAHDGATDAGDAAADAAHDGATDAGDAGDATVTDAGDAGDATCSVSAPTVDTTIAVPTDAGVFLHVLGVGTQDYACTDPGDGGTVVWKLTGPEAELRNCGGQVLGHHFASDGGPTAPEWALDVDGGDQSWVIGSKVAAFDAGSESVPWLLLSAASTSDAGTLSATTYIQRLNTDGGNAPSAACMPDSGVAKIGYTADYYFYGH